MTIAASGTEAIEVVYTAEAIAGRIEVLAKAIAALRLDRLLAVPILTGSFVFAADLLRGLHRAGLSPEVDFLSMSSYRRARSRSARSISCATCRSTLPAAMC